jgi:signal transduction histidine kinase
VMMPTLGGFGLLRELRADPVLRAVPLILLSARAGEEASVEGLEAGADDYLVKPFNARELVARVRTHLEMVRVRREVAAAEAREATLREAVRARDDFLSVASHELKTPLAAFRLQMDLLERGLDPEVRARMSERLIVARRQVQRLASVVETLLDVSQLTSGRLHLRLEPLDLAALVTEGVMRMHEETARAGCAVTVSAAAPVPGHFDRVRLEAVVQNLLSNAVKFGAGKPIEVRVWGEGRRAPRDAQEAPLTWPRPARAGPCVGLPAIRPNAIRAVRGDAVRLLSVVDPATSYSEVSPCRCAALLALEG